MQIDENPYAPPRANCVVVPSDSVGIIQELQHQSTWRLVFLAVITLGVYFVHYCARQTKIINRYVPGAISQALVVLLFVLYYTSLVVFIPYVF